MLSHCKLCELADFSHPELLAVLRDVFPHERGRFGLNFPGGVEYRKHWEVAMAVRALAAGGATHPQAEVLGIGAGGEPTIFHLTTHVRRVFATDLYLGEGGWKDQAPPLMMTDPGQFWPGPWHPRRLVVQHMNALDLKYDDNSFDGVFSSSSLEHFGTPADIRRAVGEMHRVLKPGGVMSVSTEFRLSGPGSGLPGVHMFTAEEVSDWLLGDGWQPLSPLDLSAATGREGEAISFAAAAEDVTAHCRQNGGLYFHRLDWRHYPHIVLAHNGYLWTSVHLAARKV
jgi:SAM-dependent methyltransferase